MIRKLSEMTPEEATFVARNRSIEEVKELVIARNKVIMAPLEPAHRIGWEQSLWNFRTWRKGQQNGFV